MEYLKVFTMERAGCAEYRRIRHDDMRSTKNLPICGRFVMRVFVIVWCVCIPQPLSVTWTSYSLRVITIIDDVPHFEAYLSNITPVHVCQKHRSKIKKMILWRWMGNDYVGTHHNQWKINSQCISQVTLKNEGNAEGKGPSMLMRGWMHTIT